MVSYAAIRSSKTAPGTAAMTEASLIDTKEVFHCWRDSLQDGTTLIEMTPLSCVKRGVNVKKNPTKIFNKTHKSEVT